MLVNTEDSTAMAPYGDNVIVTETGEVVWTPEGRAVASGETMAVAEQTSYVEYEREGFDSMRAGLASEPELVENTEEGFGFGIVVRRDSDEPQYTA